jgi:hypothetical protein
LNIDQSMDGGILGDPNFEQRAELPTCRICWESESDVAGLASLISPCSCRGTQAFVHAACLDHWRAHAADADAETSQREAARCPTCRCWYRPPYGLPVWRRILSDIANDFEDAIPEQLPELMLSKAVTNGLCCAFYATSLVCAMGALRELVRVLHGERALVYTILLRASRETAAALASAVPRAIRAELRLAPVATAAVLGIVVVACALVLARRRKASFARAEPRVGMLLVASAAVLDHHPFHRAVAIVTSYDAAFGARALIVNRPLGERRPPGAHPRTRFGGPHGATPGDNARLNALLRPIERAVPPPLGCVELLDGLLWCDLSTLGRTRRGGPLISEGGELRIFVGEVRWAADALERELDTGTWVACDGEAGLVFWPAQARRPLWEMLAARVGAV